MKKLLFIVFIFFTKLSFSQLKNGNFELWDSTYSCPNAATLASLFNVANPVCGSVSNWPSPSFGISRTTDSHSGNYAVILHNFYGYAYGELNYHDSLSRRPVYFGGYYKYFVDAATDTHASVWIALTKFNGVSTDTIAENIFQLDSISAYTAFQFPFTYYSASVPDSIRIFIINGYSVCDTNSICHLFYLDDVSLSDAPLSVDKITHGEPQFSVYANPGSSQLAVTTNCKQPFQISLYNFSGQTVLAKTLRGTSNSVDFSFMPNGVYFYSIAINGQIVKGGKVVKQ
jgi:hypothetical protein